jgi:large subunit ribosomal protein L15
MLELNNLKPAKGARRRRKRVGRGQGSGSGKTSARGMKGHNSRSGTNGRRWFEGGQMPLYRRVPKRGFSPPRRIENQVVNLQDFERFEQGRDVDVAYLQELGLVSGPEPRVKILGDGDLQGAFQVKVHAVSAAARQKIEATGGSVEIVPWGRPKYEKPKRKRKADKRGAPQA